MSPRPNDSANRRVAWTSDIIGRNRERRGVDPLENGSIGGIQRNAWHAVHPARGFQIREVIARRIGAGRDYGQERTRLKQSNTG